MYMRFLSDLHLEFDADAIKRGSSPFEIPKQETDSETVLVLAGDVAVADKPLQYKDFILDATNRFKHVIWIMGNHEHWRGSILRSFKKIERAVGRPENLSVVENEVVSIDGVDFICATLWTDFANGNPLAMLYAQTEVNDHKRIRTGDADDPYARYIHPNDTYALHRVSKDFIIESLNASTAKKKIVVTHHAPSYQSIDPYYRGDKLNPAYASPLDDLIVTLEPDYWIHGHIHVTNNYNIGKTAILSNPRGYSPNHLNPEFNPLWTIDLS